MAPTPDGLRLAPLAIGMTVTTAVPLGIATVTSGADRPAGIMTRIAIAAWMVDGFWSLVHAGRRVYYVQRTPLGDAPPESLTEDGPFAVRRNPMTVGAVKVISGWSALLGRPVILAWAFAVLAGSDVAIRRIEEPSLFDRFGPQYARYRRRTPKWGWFRG